MPRYGGPEKFTEYVRGPLQQELIGKRFGTITLSLLANVSGACPPGYTLVIISPLLGVPWWLLEGLGAKAAMNSVMALIKVGAPPELIFSYLVAGLLGRACWLSLMASCLFSSLLRCR